MQGHMRPLQILLLAIVLNAGVFSQNVPVFTDTASLVTVPCVISDSQGLSINDLRIGDFRLYVDGALRKIDSLWRDADLPLLLGVINDVSDSQRIRVSEKNRQINQSLERIVQGQDRAFVVAVNDRVILTSEVSAGTYGLRFRVLAPGGEELGVQCGSITGDRGHNRPLCGGTALWNAIYASAHLKLNDGTKNKVMLVLSDGNDTGSTHSFSDALNEVQKQGIAVYAIQYPDSLSTGAPSDELARLTEVTGGQLFDLRTTDFAEAISRIAGDLRGRYILAFRPESTGNDGKPHSLRVEITRPGVTIRARSEYSER
jgi:Ca-activated chloride channel family protein